MNDISYSGSQHEMECQARICVYGIDHLFVELLNSIHLCVCLFVCKLFKMEMDN